MKKIGIAQGRIEASEIGLGCMRMADLEKNQAEKVIKTALEEGVNFLIMPIFMEKESRKRFLQKL